MLQSFQRGPRKCWRWPSFWKTSLVNNDQNVEVVRAVMAKDPPIECQDDCRRNGLNKNAAHRILTEDLHLRKICEKLVTKNLSVEQKRTRWKFVRICWKDLKLSKFFAQSNNRRWIMVIRLRSWDQTTKCGMAHEKFSLSEESTQIRGENHDYCFFQQPWHCAQRICTSRTDS